jgi:sulfide dehydrogenase cytochrome subunit
MYAARLLAAIAVCVGSAGAAISAAAEPPPGASSCSGCHAARPGVDSAVPRLAGRVAGDIAAQMQAFKSGQRPSTVMGRIARGLSDAEVEAIAAWYAQQK